MLDHLKMCRHCGGSPEYYVEYKETEFGVKKCIALRCSACHSRTALYMCEDDDPSIVSSIEDLWNRGRITKYV